MDLELRRANLEDDAPAMIALFARHLNPRYDGARFDWAYRRNPHGPGIAWVLVNRATGDIIGTAAAFRRSLRIDGAACPGFVLSDFCVAEGFRALGPALRLQRACLDLVDSGHARFCYDFPSRTMLAVYDRLGIGTRADAVRFARPLRIDRHVQRIVRSPAIASRLAVAGNVLLARPWARPLGDDRLDVDVHRGRCTEEFSALGSELNSAYGTSVERDHAYLNWRYLDNPIEDHELLTVREDGVLRGYVVIARGSGRIVDIFAADPDRTVPALMEVALARLRDTDAETVSVLLHASSPWPELIRSLGFKAREATPFVTYSHDVVSDAPWFLTAADADA